MATDVSNKTIKGLKNSFGTEAAKAAPAIEPINAGTIMVMVSGISGFKFLK